MSNNADQITKIRQAMMNPALKTRFKTRPRLKRPVTASEKLALRQYARTVFPRLKMLAGKDLEKSDDLYNRLVVTYGLLNDKERKNIMKSIKVSEKAKKETK